MKITIDEMEFVFPEKLQNKHIEQIGIGKLMWLQRLVAKNTKPEEEMNDREYKEYSERMDEIVPIFFRILQVLGVTDLPELPITVTFKLMADATFLQWLQGAIGGVF